MARPPSDAEFTEFVHASWPALYRTAYLMLGDRGLAEDLVQTALARTMLAWPRLRDRSDLDGYVYRVMVRQQASWWERRWHGERPTLELPEQATPDTTTTVDEADSLARALALLPRQQRTAVVLRFYEDRPEREVADLLGCSVGSVKTHTSRGLARLRQILEPDGERSIG